MLEINLPASKSISNRLLLINALSGGKIRIENLSEANDTLLMQKLLNSSESALNTEDSGTVMRFLTAYLSIKTEKKNLLSGTAQMHKRPIKILVESLKELGANIGYVGEVGFPPLNIYPFQTQKKSSIKVEASVSSQYISALMMIAPYFPDGLHIHLKGKISSEPYIFMTAELMKYCGADVIFQKNIIQIFSKKYQETNIKTEADWSAASYWYAVLLCSNFESFLLKGLREKSLQGDSRVADIFMHFGIHTNFSDEGALINKTSKKLPETLEIDFSDIPDLAQTMAVCCAMLGIELRMKGLESLRIKETDRIKALQNELQKMEVKMQEEEGVWVVKGKIFITKKLTINTYDDHRMAMSFAVLKLKYSVDFDKPEVVKKSYPNFWKELEKVLGN